MCSFHFSQLELFCCFIFLFVCNAYLASPSCLCCAFLFSWPRLRDEEEEEEQPVTEPNSEEEIEDDAPSQGKDRYQGLEPSRSTLKDQGSFLVHSLQPPVSSLLPSSLAPTGKPFLTLCTEPQSD